MTSVGRWTSSMSQAVVADLPVPVAPRRTMSCSPAVTRRARSAIAVGWSPAGSYSATTSKGATVRCRSVTGRMVLTVCQGCDSPANAASPAEVGGADHPLHEGADDRLGRRARSARGGGRGRPAGPTRPGLDPVVGRVEPRLLGLRVVPPGETEPGEALLLRPVLRP